jgi:hypothetical protein
MKSNQGLKSRMLLTTKKHSTRLMETHQQVVNFFQHLCNKTNYVYKFSFLLKNKVNLIWATLS